MELNKAEEHILNNILYYKLLSCFSMIFGFFGIPYGLHFVTFTKVEISLKWALIGASIVIVGCGLLIYKLLKMIDKFKKELL